MVFYRKYRPQKIEELDSFEVREKLLSVLSAKTVPHAFLFTGPKGLGKTSTARIVAKSVNCEQIACRKSHVADKKDKPSSTSEPRKAKSAVEPCNKCNQCVSIANGTNIDVLEIDGASNRGIDEIRDLREKVRLSPAASKYKVYIIDEVHMLTPEAFNALLKTLEEPPPHVIFVLCTTEPQKVPQTILSRCFHIGFRKAQESELIRSFVRIVKKEKIKIDKDALDLIAKLSDGSFRDGVKILEEMAGVSGRKKITKELIESKFQISNFKFQISEMLGFLAKKDTKGSLKLVADVTKQGLDMKFFLEQLINELHSFLLAELGIVNNESGIGKDSKLSVAEIKGLVEMLGKAYGELEYAVLPQLPLEMAIIEWGMGNDSDNRLPHIANDARPMFSKNQQNSRSLSERLPSSLGGKSKNKQTAFSSSASGQTIIASGNNDKSGIWPKLIEEVNSYNRSVAGVLRGCRLKSFTGGKLTIEAGFKFHKDRLEEGKTKLLIAKIYKEIAGEDIGISVVLKRLA